MEKHKTTLILDGDAFATAKGRAALQGVSLSHFVSEAIRVYEGMEVPENRQPIRLTTYGAEGPILYCDSDKHLRELANGDMSDEKNWNASI